MKPASIAIACVLGFGGLPSLAVAADAPSARQLELAHRYIELIHVDKSYAETMKALAPAVLASMPKGKGGDPALQQKVFDAANEAASAMMVTLVKKMEPIMAATYSEEELGDLVTFYESKTGRALIEKQPLLVSRMGPLMGEIMPQFQKDLQARICAKVDCKALEKE